MYTKPTAMTYFTRPVSPRSIPWIRILIGWLPIFVPGLLSAQPAIEGYRNYQALYAELESIATSPLGSLSSIGETHGGRAIPLLTLSIGDPEKKPAILIVGNVDPPHRVGSELAVRLAKHLANCADTDRGIKEFLSRLTIYVIPCPTPDASEAFFLRPSYERTGNVRATDDDRDGMINEDPPDDLNGDGLITMMRIADPTGKYIPHPRDPRVMVQFDPIKNERGRYRLLQEGIDNDGDEQFNEDGPGGIHFNRNFPFQYPYFEAGAGPHQVSEPETRAVADFAFDHPNIYAVLTFSPNDNLCQPWKSNPATEPATIKTAVLEADAAYYQTFSQLFHDTVGLEKPPTTPSDQGSFVHWVYYHFGRWSLGSRGWSIPNMEKDPGNTTLNPVHNSQTESPRDAKIPRAMKSNRDVSTEMIASNTLRSASIQDIAGPDIFAVNRGKRFPESSWFVIANPPFGLMGSPAEHDKDPRGTDELNALRWFAKENINGFVPWTPIEHRDFPGKQVEIGGIRPYLVLNPPTNQLDRLAVRHAELLLDFADRRPRLVLITDPVESLGEGIFRLVVTIRNDGYLPTMSAMGAKSRQLVRLEAKIELPDGARLATGSLRVPLEPLAGAGGFIKQTWLISTAQESDKKTVRIAAGSPTLGTVESTIELP